MNLVIGLIIIGYSVYVIGQCIQIAFGWNDGSWSEMKGHFIFIGSILFLAIIGHFVEKKENRKKENKPNTPSASSGKQEGQGHVYNPYVDKLDFGIYRQSFKTWWNDSDGDYNYHSNIYASLRFYKNGTVIGIRSEGLPKIEIEKSYTMKGTWELTENKINFNLQKTVEIDDWISVEITEQERREMKYFGEIADNNSLIQAGQYEGTIIGNSIHIAGFVFTKLPLSQLIVTADEDTCSQLENRIIDHLLVVDTFQNTGNWYSNGETGPEWFTISIYTAEEFTTEVEYMVKKELLVMGDFAHNLYWA